LGRDAIRPQHLEGGRGVRQRSGRTLWKGHARGRQAHRGRADDERRAHDAIDAGTSLRAGIETRFGAAAIAAPSRKTEEMPPRQRGVMRRGAGARDLNTDIAESWRL